MAHWSKLQASVALSSGEAELNGCVKALVEGIGIWNLYHELLGWDLELRLYIDASACRGMLLRKGVGRTKHLCTTQLWAQGAVESYNVQIEKIPRAQNCADLLTHLVSRPEADAQLKRMGYRWP